MRAPTEQEILQAQQEAGDIPSDMSSMPTEQDIAMAQQQAGEYPDTFMGNISHFLGSTLQGLSNPVGSVLNTIHAPTIAGAALEGAANAGPKQLNQLAVAGLNKLLGTNIPSVTNTQVLSPQQEASPYATAGHLLGQLGVGAMAGGPAMAISGQLERLGLSRIPSLLAGSGAVGAGYGALTNPQNPLSGAAWGGGLGLGGEGLTQGASGLGNALLRKIVNGKGAFGAEITPEEVQARAAVLNPGTKVPLAVAANSPNLRVAETLSKLIPFSGAAKAYQGINDEMMGTLQGLLGNKTPEDFQNLPQKTFDEQATNYENAKPNTQQSYANFDQVSNAPFNRQPIDDYLNSTLNKLQTKKMFNPAGKEMFGPVYDYLKSYQEPSTMIPDYQTAVSVREQLNDYLRGLDTPNQYKYSTYVMGLKGAVDKALATPPEGISQDASNLFNLANQSRIDQGKFENLNKKQMTPFFNIYSKNGDPGNYLNQYLKPSSNTSNQSSLLQSLTSQISPETAQTIGAAHLLNTGNLSKEPTTSSIVSNLGKLNQDQVQQLFGDKAPLAAKLTNIAKLYPEGKAPNYLPPTGALGEKANEAVKGATAIGALLMGHLAPHIALGAGTGVGLLRGANSAMSSDWLRNAYINALKGKTVIPANKQSLLQGIINVLNAPSQQPQQPMTLNITHYNRRPING